jgi:hypothetical protein
MKEYNVIMPDCLVIICVTGWVGQCPGHWDAWISGNRVLMDSACYSVEMIPGVRLEEGVHYLVFDDPKEIPHIVSDWTRRSRLDELAQIAENGRRAALSYDACGRIADFFENGVKVGTATD